MIHQLDLNPGEPLSRQVEHISPQLYNFFQQILENLIKNPEFQSAITGSGSPDGVVMELFVNGVRYTLYHASAPAIPFPVSLSPREKEIVRLVANGLPTKAIATTLEVSPWTVGTHLRRIFSKLGVKSRAEMVARSLENNLLAEK